MSTVPAYAPPFSSRGAICTALGATIPKVKAKKSRCFFTKTGAQDAENAKKSAQICLKNVSFAENVLSIVRTMQERSAARNIPWMRL